MRGAGLLGASHTRLCLDGSSRRAPLVVEARRSAQAPAKTVRGTKVTTIREHRQQQQQQQQQRQRTQQGTSTSGRGRAEERPASRNGSRPGTRFSDGTVSSSSGDGKAVPSKAYFNFTGFPFPLGPFFKRDTVRTEIVKDTMWTFEQTQALDFFDVYTPVRMTVIRLSSGGLWVHAPVAPTEECIRLVKELGGPVEYIVLPTFCYEHKIFVAPFSRRFPNAKVYTTPYQWSFPLNLPPQLFGIFPAGELRSDDPNVPWADDIEQKLFLSPNIGVDKAVRFTECAFYHKRTRTLLVTDAVIYVGDKAPSVIPTKALLGIARDGWLARLVSGGRSKEEVQAVARDEKEAVEDTPQNRMLGWMRMCLLVLYFQPADILTPQASFAAISKRLYVAPVLQTLVYNKCPNAICDWVDSICTDWRFERIIPCHFNAPVRTTPDEFQRAFTFAYDAAGRALAPPEKPSGLGGLLGGLFGGKTEAGEAPYQLPEADLKTMNNINNTLLRLGAVYADAESRQ